jgi:ATP-dependent RNA helicase DHX29
MKKKILATYASHSNDDSPTPTVSSGRTSPDLDPNAEYARIKVQLQLRKMGRPAPGADAQNADEEKRLEALQAHYLFSSKQAEALFNAEHAQAKALALDARLRAVPDVVASDSDTSSNIEATRKRRPPNLNAAQQPSSAKSIKSAVDILEDTDAADSEGIFGTMLDEMPAAETSSAGTVITIRNTALPKHWAAGHTPKGLLKENVQKSDRYAAITYHRVGGASRAARAGVSIRWEGGKDTEWNMETEGCHDERQAEQYVSTIALHSLTFNPLPGFASSISSGAHTYFRLLPPVFRDLWDELEIKRKKGEAATNRQIWGKLRSIVEPRLGPIAKVCLICNNDCFPDLNISLYY